MSTVFSLLAEAPLHPLTRISLSFVNGAMDNCGELVVANVPTNVKIDWTVRENVLAHVRVLVKLLFRKYGYPPDEQEKATQTGLEQEEVLAAAWAA